MEAKEKVSEDKAKHKLPQGHHLVLMHGSMIKEKQVLLIIDEIMGGFQFGTGSFYLTKGCSS
ncbi:hypothetical protein DITRI_Ditri15bG0138500 [Diplodiscus trichospermus]